MPNTNRPADQTGAAAKQGVLPTEIQDLGPMDSETNSHKASAAVKNKVSSRPADSKVPAEAAKNILQVLVNDKVTTVSDDEAVKIVESGAINTVFGMFTGTIEESVANIFADDSLTEAQSQQINTLFQVAVANKVQSVRGELQEDMQTTLDEDRSLLITKIDAFLSTVIKEWKRENSMAIDDGAEKMVLQNFAESVLSGLSSCGISSDAFSKGQAAELTSSLTEANDRIATLESELGDTKKESLKLQTEAAFDEATTGMTQVEKDHLGQMVESVKFEDTESYTKAVKLIAEHFVLVKSNKVTINENNSATKGMLAEESGTDNTSGENSQSAAMAMLKRMNR